MNFFLSFFMTLISMISLNFIWSSYYYWNIMLEMNFTEIYSMNLSFIFVFDFFSLMFLNLLMNISIMIFFFSNFYMNTSKSKRFSLLMILFLSAMILLIFSSNIFSMIFGWDGLGISSLLLIMYYSNYLSIYSSFLTFLFTRLGDVFIICSIILMMEFLDFFMLSMKFTFIFLIMSLGFLTKSAQLPFCAWLPLSMSAPTPVSALVHSSTLVTAGVYMMIRYNFFLSKTFWITMFLSLLTFFYSSMFALLEKDLKKLVAMSTLSQMSLLVLMMSYGETNICFFHLNIHAYFKSMIFMLIGMKVALNEGNQDSRFNQTSLFYEPMMKFILILCCGSIFAFPFFSGFFSKELFISSLFFFELKPLFNLYFILSCILSSLYSVRIMFESIYLLNRGKKDLNFKTDSMFMKLLFFFSFLVTFKGIFLNYFMFLEELFIFKKLEKFVTLVIYLFSLTSVLVFMDIMYLFNNKYGSMIYLNFWTLNFLFKKIKMEKVKFLDNNFIMFFSIYFFDHTSKFNKWSIFLMKTPIFLMFIMMLLFFLEIF